MIEFSVIAALDEGRGIGMDGTLPWRLPSDLRFFRMLTTRSHSGSRNAVIMGRATWESLPPRFRPLPERENVVISRLWREAPAGCLLAPDFESALMLARERGAEQLFCIGGGQLYRAALAHAGCRTLFLTRVLARFACDTFFPEFESSFDRAEILESGNDGGLEFRIERWLRRI